MFVKQVSETAKRLIVSTKNESDILKINCFIIHPIFAPTLAASVYMADESLNLANISQVRGIHLSLIYLCPRNLDFGL